MKIVRQLVDLPRWSKRSITVLVDVVGLLLVATLALWLRLGDATFPLRDYSMAVLLPLLAVPVFIMRGMYRAVIRYIGFKFALTVFSTVTMVALLWATVVFMFQLPFPRSGIVITWLLMLLFIAVTRVTMRWLLLEGGHRDGSRKRVVIFGAGSSGQQLMNAMMRIPGYKVVLV